ncbi:hypothetical protein GN956_G9073 [Arapaima gigas]
MHFCQGGREGGETPQCSSLLLQACCSPPLGGGTGAPDRDPPLRFCLVSLMDDGRSGPLSPSTCLLHPYVVKVPFGSGPVSQGWRTRKARPAQTDNVEVEHEATAAAAAASPPTARC